MSYTCAYCKKEFNDMSDLLTHIKKYEKENEYAWAITSSAAKKELEDRIAAMIEDLKVYTDFFDWHFGFTDKENEVLIPIEDTYFWEGLGDGSFALYGALNKEDK